MISSMFVQHNIFTLDIRKLHGVLSECEQCTLMGYRGNCSISPFVLPEKNHHIRRARLPSGQSTIFCLGLNREATGWHEQFEWCDGVLTCTLMSPFCVNDGCTWYFIWTVTSTPPYGRPLVLDSMYVYGTCYVPGMKIPVASCKCMGLHID